MVGQLRYFHRWDYVFSGVAFTSSPAQAYPVASNTNNLAIGWRTQIADSAGAVVLFKAPGGFAFGTQVLTAQNQPLPNGNLLAPYSDALLVPRPWHPETVYFVSVTRAGTRVQDLAYSILDTRLNGNQGDVVTGGPRFDSLNQVLHTQALPGLLLARHANRRDFWLLSVTTTEVHCYAVTPAGIRRTAVRSGYRSAAPTTASGEVNLRLTSRGTQLLLTRPVPSSSAGGTDVCTELYQFDPATGQLTQGRLLQVRPGIQSMRNGLTPSPTGRYAYDVVDSLRGRRPTSQVVQYDLQAVDTAAFRRSRRRVYWSDTTATDDAFALTTPLRAGPDGRLYLLSTNTGTVDSLSVIERPDAPAAQCRFRRSTLALTAAGNGQDPLEHLPNGFQFLADFRTAPACLGAPVRIVLDQASFLDSARWQFGDGTSTVGLGPVTHVYTRAGTYRVRVQVYYGGYATDTLSQPVTVYPAATVLLPADTIACAGQALVLTPRNLSADVVGYRWSTGATTPAVQVTQPGTYTLTVRTAAECEATARTVVSVVPPLGRLLCPDTTICQGNPWLLRVAARAGSVQAVRWPDGSTGPTYAVTESGTYRAAITLSGGCTYEAQVTITVTECPDHFKIPNIITPNGDGRNDAFVVPGLAPGRWQLTVYNRWGRTVYQAAQYVNGAWDGAGLPTGVYYYQLTRPSYHLKGWVEVVR